MNAQFHHHHTIIIVYCFFFSACAFVRESYKSCYTILTYYMPLMAESKADRFSLSIYFILHATLSWIWLFCLIFQPHKIICDYIITDTVHMYIIMAMHYTIAHTPYLYTLIHESVARRFCTTFNFSCVIHQTLYIWFDWCVSNQHHSFSRHDE